jgi:hypothetical protein
MARVREITPEVREVLVAGTCEGNLFKLPDMQLERKLYVAVNKTLDDLGGKWNRKRAGHVFKVDCVGLLATALEEGGTVNQKQELQSFFTPPDVAQVAVEHALVKGMSVLEPSAGEGALADECVRQGAANVTCCEQHDPYVETLRGKGYPVRHEDFLEMSPRPVFERVVMNPPFTRNQDVTHVKRALQWLTPDGRLVAIMADNVDRRPFVELRAAITAGGFLCGTYRLPEGSFKSSGTNIRTLILVVAK